MTNCSRLLGNDLEVFYWMGLILADGSIFHPTSRLSLELADRDHVERFRLFLGVNATIHSRDRNRNHYVALCDSESVPKIVSKFDLKRSKTYAPPSVDHYREWFSREQLIALAVGFIDGDGNVRSQKAGGQITLENHASWADFQCFLVSEIFFLASLAQDRSYARLNCRGYSCISINKKPVIKALLRFIETNNLPIMRRKWDTISHLLDEPDRKPRRPVKTQVHRFKKDALVFEGTENALFHAHPELHSSGIGNLVKGKLKSYKGWRLAHTFPSEPRG